MLNLYYKGLYNNIIFKNITYIKGLYLNNFELNLITTEKLIYFLSSVLKKNQKFKFNSLIDIFICDFPELKNRFFLTYNILSIKYNVRVSIRLFISEANYVISILGLYSSACWLEREAWDMFGVFFLFNPSLTRILTDYGFKGYPLRKDFPLTGYFEVFYNDFIKSIIFTKVSLSQDYRNFSFFNNNV